MRAKLILFTFIWFSLYGVVQSAEPDWNTKMQEFRSLLTELIPDVISDEEFNSPQNFERIKQHAKRLALLTHAMPQGKLPSDSDPSIGMISTLFKDEILLAHQNLQIGNRTYARRVLRSIPKYCIACHTRFFTPLDASPTQNEAPERLKTSLDRAQYYDATWQFDRALDEFEKIVKSPLAAKEQQLDWKKAVYFGIATAVRVKRDPDRALIFVDAALNSLAAPLFLKKDAMQWKTSLLDWKKEWNRKLETEDQLIEEAKRLVDDARLLQNYPMDRSADILYLRATSTLHEFLSNYSESPKSGEALLMLGSCYEILQDLDLWSLHELYFETCIRKFPHSPIAQACYERYEQSTFVGYSGSAGLSLPSEIKIHLDKLRKLAGPI